ncbi:MAG: hypothetical protein IMZ61_10150 [Planctomycetes bacterium]|nr:hypothetical protein [Planctomycetota bacterium]
MDYVKYIVTPVTNGRDNPLSTRLKMTKGRLISGFLFFPSGAEGTLHCRARIGLTQILPFNTDETIRLDDCVINFGLGINLIEPPYEVEILTFNESLLYSHALTIGFSLIPKNKKLMDVLLRKAGEMNTEGYIKK